MRYEILGPLRVVDGKNAKTIRAQKVEILLVALVVRADQVVSTDQLIREIWGEEPPRSATASLYVYISQIRKLLRHTGTADSPVLTRPPGYMLTLGPDGLDLHDFTRLLKEGRDHLRSRRYEAAVRAFEDALALCRGPLLADIARGPILQGFRTWLNEAQLECQESLMDAHLALGRHRELVSDLYLLSTEHPMREAFHRQLMLALHRSGSRGDALLVYQRARRTLRDELGVEPGSALRDIQRVILTDDGSVGSGSVR
ncbi:AfsR/SARP family transcriptional regulator [Streptomyces sp. Isolate_219]|uniref:AfsR/SARP family transcriptional regulator n=1 Tax=Streptomyces sp. Isolate_219 TaxID=2950110 RepID=UPI0021C94271|nr:AfsR/SARP family transcriptional regulator [Streptomyces sp. Isolate_219]MCR8579119.1 AfsR/SARP family transcriptional regulator [Streptomyces sp. Isolate_219]